MGTSSIEEDNTGTHDALVIRHQADTPATIGDPDSTVSVDGRIISLNGDVAVNGKDIHLYEGTKKTSMWWPLRGYNVSLGSDTTDQLPSTGGVLAMGGSSDGTMALKGRTITLDAKRGHNALQANNMPLDVGSDATRQVSINGEIFSAGGACAHCGGRQHHNPFRQREGGCPGVYHRWFCGCER